MSIRSQLEKKIENKFRDIEEMELILREQRAFLAGMQEALKGLPKDNGDERKSGQILRPGSDMAKARDYLKLVGTPLYITEILKGIGKELTKKHRISVGGSLSMYARKNEIFSKTAPNTFGLIEFDNRADDEPPEGFGTMEESENTEGLK